MTKTFIAAVLGSCLPFVAAAAPSVMGHGQATAAARVAPDATCFTNAGTDTANAILSQNFTDAGGTYDAYDSQAADDFKVKAGKKCVANGLSVTGQFFNGTGPAESLTVTYYADKSHHPGKVVKSFAGLDASTGPSFNVSHGKATLKATADKAKSFWVSPVVDMAFGGGTTGEWGWEVQSEITGNEANWQNPGGGFGICPTWDTITTCIGVTGDFMFSVKGKTSPL